MMGNGMGMNNQGMGMGMGNNNMNNYNSVNNTTQSTNPQMELEDIYDQNDNNKYQNNGGVIYGAGTQNIYNGGRRSPLR